MDKHIILKLASLEINELDGGKDGGVTKVVNKDEEKEVVSVRDEKEANPYYEVLWLTGC